MVWPILISLSVTPGVSARAEPALAAKAAAAALDCRNERRVSMELLLFNLLVAAALGAACPSFARPLELTRARRMRRAPQNQPDKISPNRSQLSPLNFESCICRIGL